MNVAEHVVEEPIEAAELAPEPALLGAPSWWPTDDPPLPIRIVWGGITFGFGAVGLLAGLATLAMIPVLQFMTLGWLLEAEGRVGRGGGLRGALPGLAKVARIGSAIIGCLIVSLPFLLLRGYRLDALLLDPASSLSASLGTAQLVVGLLTAAYALLAIGAGGGKLNTFLRPIHNLGWLADRIQDRASPAEAWRSGVEFLRDCRLPYYLSLGTRGFVAAGIWLAIPTALLVLGGKVPPVALLGLLALIVVIPYVVVAQARLAAEDDFGAAFRLGEIRRRAHRAPLATAIAVVATLGLALPLYLFKIELLPRDALWLPAVFFVVALLPGRLLAGWAHARGARTGRAPWLLRLIGLGVTVPAAGVYVFFVFVSQYFSWSGAASLFAHHAFLLPVAFY